MANILILVLNAVIILVAVLAFIFMRRRRLDEGRESIAQLGNLQIIPPEGIDVPVTQTFSGLKPLGAVGISHNNMNPRLVLYDERIEYRVIIKTSRRYGDIERVKIVGNRQLRFIFYGQFFTLSTWLSNAEDRATLVNFLRSRGVNIEE